MMPTNRASQRMTLLRMAASLSPSVAKMLREHDKREKRIRDLADAMGAPRQRRSDKPRGIIPPHLTRKAGVR